MLFILLGTGWITEVIPSKLRAWIPEKYLYEGEIPSPRYYHGMTRLAGKIYIFGGWDNSGSKLFSLL